MSILSPVRRLRLRQHAAAGAQERAARCGRLRGAPRPRPRRHLRGARGHSATAPRSKPCSPSPDDRRALHEALRRNLARTLGELRTFYEGHAGELVDLLLSRFDLHNLLALLRGSVRGQAAPRKCSRTPSRSARSATLRRTRSRANQSPPGRSTCSSPGDCPIPHSPARSPTPGRSTSALDDLAALEHALAIAPRAAASTEAARAAGEDAEPLRELIAREHDAINVLIVLRLRFALQLRRADRVAAAARPRPLSGRREDRRAEALETALRQPTRAEAVARLIDAARREDWRAPLERIAAGGDLPTAAARARGQPRPLGRRPLPPRRPARRSTSRSRTRSRRRTRCATCACSAKARPAELPAAALRAQLIVPLRADDGTADRRSRRPSSSRVTGLPGSRRARPTRPPRRRRRLDELLDAGAEGDVVAVHEPFFNELDAPLRRRIDSLVSPLVVALPGGEGADAEAERRAQHLRVLWEAVGYEITFDRQTAQHDR